MADCGIITLEEEEDEDEKDIHPEDELDVTSTEVDKQILYKQITNTDEHLLEEDPDDKHLDEHSFLEEYNERIDKEEGLGLEEVRKTLGELHLKKSFQHAQAESESASGSLEDILDQLGNNEIADQKRHAGVDQRGNVKQIKNMKQTFSTDPALWLSGENTATSTNLTMSNLDENRDDMALSIPSNNPNAKIDKEQDVPESDDANQFAGINFNPLEQRGQITFKEYTGKSPNLNEGIGQISNKSTSENILASVPSVNLGSILQTSSIVTRLGWRGIAGEEAGKYKTFNNNVNTVRVNDNNNNIGRRRICSWHNVGFCRRRSHCRDFHPSLVSKSIKCVMIVILIVMIMIIIVMNVMIVKIVMIIKMMMELIVKIMTMT